MKVNIKENAAMGGELYINIKMVRNIYLLKVYLIKIVKKENLLLQIKFRIYNGLSSINLMLNCKDLTLALMMKKKLIKNRLLIALNTLMK